MLGWVQGVPLQTDTFTIVKIQTNICRDGKQVKMELILINYFYFKFMSFVDH